VAGRSANRTGVLVISVWLEPGEEGLRARITRTVDITARDEIATVATTPDEIARVVRDWLDAFLLGPADVTDR
jgi:hypothetical protein